MRVDPTPSLISTQGLSVTYLRGSGLGGRKVEVTALEQVDFAVPAAATLAVVGESGSGKSTLGRCLALLEEPTAGEILVGHHRWSELGRRQQRDLRPRFQLIFQDPASALNPRFSAWQLVCEPLLIRRWANRARRRERALELMEEVGLCAEHLERTSLELSGGEKQRLVIARALAAEPRLLILDEALSSLDLSLQAQIVDLLQRLQERYGLSYVFISHDLRRVAHLADTAAVLDRGRLVELGAPREILRRPRHAATRRLVSSMLGE